MNINFPWLARVAPITAVALTLISVSGCSTSDQLDFCADDGDCGANTSCFFAREDALGVCTRGCDSDDDCDGLGAAIGEQDIPTTCFGVRADGTLDPAADGVCIFPCNRRDDPPIDPACGNPDYICHGTGPGTGGICIGRPGWR
jgi:hypothetical protein